MCTASVCFWLVACCGRWFVCLSVCVFWSPVSGGFIPFHQVITIIRFLASSCLSVHLGRSFEASPSWHVTLVTRWTSAPSTFARGRCSWANWTRTVRDCGMTTTTRTRWDEDAADLLTQQLCITPETQMNFSTCSAFFFFNKSKNCLKSSRANPTWTHHCLSGRRRPSSSSPSQRSRTTPTTKWSQTLRKPSTSPDRSAYSRSGKSCLSLSSSKTGPGRDVCWPETFSQLQWNSFFPAAVLGEEAQRSECLRHRRGAGENNGAAKRPSR